MFNDLVSEITASWHVTRPTIWYWPPPWNPWEIASLFPEEHLNLRAQIVRVSKVARLGSPGLTYPVDDHLYVTANVGFIDSRKEWRSDHDVMSLFLKSCSETSRLMFSPTTAWFKKQRNKTKQNKEKNPAMWRGRGRRKSRSSTSWKVLIMCLFWPVFIPRVFPPHYH